MNRLETITPNQLAMLAVPFKSQVSLTKDLSIISAPDFSMTGTFENGDALFVDTTYNTIPFDGVYAFNYLGHSYIKRLQKQGNRIAVLSSEPTMETWYIEDKANIDIIGRVLGSLNLKKY